MITSGLVQNVRGQGGLGTEGMAVRIPYNGRDPLVSTLIAEDEKKLNKKYISLKTKPTRNVNNEKIIKMSAQPSLHSKIQFSSEGWSLVDLGIVCQCATGVNSVRTALGPLWSWRGSAAESAGSLPLGCQGTGTPGEGPECSRAGVCRNTIRS